MTGRPVSSLFCGAACNLFQSYYYFWNGTPKCGIITETVKEKDGDRGKMEFKNKTILTQDLFYEFSKAMYRKTKLIIYAISVFLLIDSMLLFLGEHFEGFIFALIFGIFFLFVSPIIYSKRAKRSYQQQLLCCGGKSPENTTEFSGRIHIVSSNKAETFFDYPQITQICETKNLLILKITRLLGIVLDKEGFTAGSLASFQTFIQQKCPTAEYTAHKNIGKTRAPAASASVNLDQNADETESENSTLPIPINPSTEEKQNVPIPAMQTYASAGFRDPTVVFPIKSHPVMRVIMMILFILSFASIYIALFLVGSHQSFSMSPIENNWMFFLPLPIPLANLILGIICKRRGMKTTKNIVVGIIFTFVLCSGGSFVFLNQTAYSHNMSYLDTAASEIHFSLPDKGKITTQNFQSDSKESRSESQTDSQSDTDAFDYDFMSNITFTDTKQLTGFEASLRGSNLWTNSIATPISGIVPELYSLQTTKVQGFDHFMIYNVDLGTYNALPDKSGTYRFIYLAYGSKEKKMLIGEYSCDVVLK